MAKIVSLDKFSEELKKYSDKSIEDYKKAVIDALLKSLVDIVKASPVDTGLYAQSWDLIITEKDAVIGNYAPHAAVIEFGARPFTPPIAPLLEWARRVLKKQEVDSHCWALAKYTQAKIAEKGMEPRHILTNQLDSIINDIRINLSKAFK
jgi:hypothetical protein